MTPQQQTALETLAGRALTQAEVAGLKGIAVRPAPLNHTQVGAAMAQEG